MRQMSDNTDLSIFVDDEVIKIVRNLSIYKHLLRSQDHDDFRDITIKQWDATTGSILCYLKNKYRKKFLFTQARLFVIAKLAAIQILKDEGKYKNPKDKCLTST